MNLRENGLGSQSEATPRQENIASRRPITDVPEANSEKVEIHFEMYIADLKAIVPADKRSFFCSTVSTTQHYHLYAATRFDFPGG